MVTSSKLAWRPPLRFLVPFVLVHSLMSVWLLVVAFGRGMARFDSGREPTVTERAVDTLSDVLLSPLFTLAVKSRALGALLPGRLGYVPVLANSVLWALFAWWLITLGRRITAQLLHDTAA